MMIYYQLQHFAVEARAAASLWWAEQVRRGTMILLNKVLMHPQALICIINTRGQNQKILVEMPR